MKCNLYITTLEISLKNIPEGQNKILIGNKSTQFQVIMVIWLGFRHCHGAWHQTIEGTQPLSEPLLTKMSDATLYGTTRPQWLDSVLAKNPWPSQPIFAAKEPLEQAEPNMLFWSFQ